MRRTQLPKIYHHQEILYLKKGGMVEMKLIKKKVKNRDLERRKKERRKRTS